MLRALALVGAFLALTPRVVTAEWHLTPMVGFTFGGGTTIVDLEDATGNVHRQYGGAVTLLGGGLVGAEAVIAYTPGFFQADGGLVSESRAFALMGNVVLTAPRRWTEYGLRPFVSGGLGYLRASYSETTFPVSSNLAGFNVGGGAIGFLTEKIGLRFDLRYYANLHRPEQGPSSPALGRVTIHYFTGSVGIVFRQRRPASSFGNAS
jgi:hypothetical protein